jgi:hypothetical protein
MPPLPPATPTATTLTLARPDGTLNVSCRTTGAQRFPTDGHFARHAGTAPIPASSGNTQRHRLHRGGDRQLNREIHIIALSRARTDPETRAYLDRKHAEGKTKLEAIRCLKRHLARRVWRLLYTAELQAGRPVLINGTNHGNTEFHLTQEQPQQPRRPRCRSEARPS